MRGIQHVHREQEHKWFWWRNLKGSDHLIDRLRCKDNNKMSQSNYMEGLDLSSSRRGPVVGLSAHGNKPSDFIKCRDFFFLTVREQLENCQLLMKNSDSMCQLKMKVEDTNIYDIRICDWFLFVKSYERRHITTTE